MSIVTIQIGQCGNQVGSELFSLLSSQGTPSDAFFRKSSKISKPIARSVLIDMEPKVIQECMFKSKKEKFHYSKKNTFYKQSGSANNWGFGYFKQGPTCKESVMKLVKAEVEKCDKFNGFLILTSLAGGTGSGVGTFLSEILRDEYSDNFMCNMIVWPYQSGEITLQNYNSVLSLSHLNEVSDGIWFFLNDFINKICTNDLRIKSPSFNDMNKVISTITSSVLLPCYDYKRNEKVSILNDLIYDLCAHPSYKFFTSKYYPFIPNHSKDFQRDSWSSIMKQIYQMMLSRNQIVNWKITKFNVNKSINNVITMRGNFNHDIHISLKPFYYPHKDLFVDWYKRNKCKIFYHKKSFITEKSACLTSNSQVIINPLNVILEKSTKMYHSNAYLHHYEKYGINKNDFVKYLSKLEQVLYDYKKL